MDTIGDFLTRIRNAGLAKHEKVDVPSSNVRAGIATVLKENGYIRNFKIVRDGKQGMMRIYLRYREDGDHAITSVSGEAGPDDVTTFRLRKFPMYVLVMAWLC